MQNSPKTGLGCSTPLSNIYMQQVCAIRYFPMAQSESADKEHQNKLYDNAKKQLR